MPDRTTAGLGQLGNGEPDFPSPSPAQVSTGPAKVDEGVELLGRFQVLSRLGKGQSGEVFLAFDKELKHQVVVKTIAPPQGAADSLLEEWRKLVVQARARPSHPALVRVLDLHFRHPPPVYTLDYAGKGTLEEHWLKRGRRLPHDEVTAIVKDLLGALDVLHADGGSHLGINPRNVLMTAEGKAKLTPLGPMPGAPQVDPKALAFRAPEQWLGQSSGPEADLYSVGLVALQLLNGKLPFEEHQAREWHLGAGTVDASWKGHDAGVFKRLLAVHPAERPTASQALSELASNLPLAAARQPLVEADEAAAAERAQSSRDWALWNDVEQQFSMSKGLNPFTGQDDRAVPVMRLAALRTPKVIDRAVGLVGTLMADRRAIRMRPAAKQVLSGFRSRAAGSTLAEIEAILRRFDADDEKIKTRQRLALYFAFGMIAMMFGGAAFLRRSEPAPPPVACAADIECMRVDPKLTY